MNFLRVGSFSGWRRSLGWLSAYALVFQLLLGAMVGGQFSAKAAGQNGSFFEICYRKGSPGGELPSGKPDKHSSKSFNCTVCANAATAVAPELPLIAPFEFSEHRIDWIVRGETLALREFSFSQRQRAPPSKA
ncbi:MAG: hypothetical protein KGZ73_08505 [Rhizobiales bacterium]|nr:hypothetical protein [Hyphomicrobiales bacterium]